MLQRIGDQRCVIFGVGDLTSGHHPAPLRLEKRLPLTKVTTNTATTEFK